MPGQQRVRRAVPGQHVGAPADHERGHVAERLDHQPEARPHTFGTRPPAALRPVRAAARRGGAIGTAGLAAVATARTEALAAATPVLATLGGLHAAMLVAGVVCLAGAVLAVVLLGRSSQ